MKKIKITQNEKKTWKMNNKKTKNKKEQIEIPRPPSSFAKYKQTTHVKVT